MLLMLYTVCIWLLFQNWITVVFLLFFLSVLDSKEAASSPTRAPSLDGALDASDLQSFAFQIANGMVTSTSVAVLLLFYSNLTLSTDKMTSWVDHEEMWIYRENAKGEGHGFNSCRDSDFFFVPCLCHVDQFTFHSSLLSSKFTIFINLSWKLT